MKRLFHICCIGILLGFPLSARTQNAGMQPDMLLLKGRVTCNGNGVPYATLNVAGTSIGVSCNDDGYFELKVPAGHRADTVVIRSLGYGVDKRSVRDLMRRGEVRLQALPIVLKEVKVSGFSSASKLVTAAVRRIRQNYHVRSAYSTFFYRDWRSLNGELYLLDEAVMGISRAGYDRYADKSGYAYSDNRREMATDYKDVLKHRLLVFDRTMLKEAVHRKRGIDMMVEYVDNAAFFDPVSTPQACYMLAKRELGRHSFEPIREFEDNGEAFYLIRSVGPGRTPKSKVNYEYTIRKSDLAIVRITSTQRDAIQRSPAPDEIWANLYFNRLTVDADTSAWIYEVRDGRYTLTRYYNSKSFRLTSSRRGYEKEVQQWQQCIDWTLTDFTLAMPKQTRKAISVSPQTLCEAFGESDNTDVSFWEQYNSIPLDILPSKLLKDKSMQRVDETIQEADAVDSVQITGTITNAVTHAPEAFCTVKLLHDSVMMRGTMSDEAGNFTLGRLPVGNYTIAISLQGMTLFHKEMSFHDDVDLNITVLPEAPKQAVDLKKVLISAKRIVDHKLGELLITSPDDPRLWGFNYRDWVLDSRPRNASASVAYPGE